MTVHRLNDNFYRSYVIYANTQHEALAKLTLFMENKTESYLESVTPGLTDDGFSLFFTVCAV